MAVAEYLGDAGHRLLICCCFAGWLVAGDRTALAQPSYASVIDGVQPKVVKVYGAGGLQGLEHYQSGFLISAQGHILTVWSYVLDSEEVIVTLHDGKRYTAALLGADPRLEIAILKIDAAELPHFALDESVSLDVGDRVLAFSNLFNVATGDEAASVLHGSVATTGNLAARKGVYQTTYRGQVLVLDAMTNNPGAAGGALTDRGGQLAGMLGKELRNAQDNTWLNYAVPMAALREAIEDLMSGKFRPRRDDEIRKPREPVSLALLGIVLVPNVLVKTPPYVDAIQPKSSAEKAGLRPDDLILFVNDRIVPSAQALREELALIDRIDEVRLVVQRGQDLVNISLFAGDR
ncbi:MAG: S1C family serine protease [Pirellulaceae bacterium]